MTLGASTVQRLHGKSPVSPTARSGFGACTILRFGRRLTESNPVGASVRCSWRPNMIGWCAFALARVWRSRWYGAVGVRSAITLAGARERDARVSTTGAGALSRRAALRGGAVTALAVMFGSRTALAQVDIPACAGVEGTPTTVSDTATLARLQSHSTPVALSGQCGRTCFRTPDWDAVLHVRGSHPVYVFSHPDNLYTAVGSNGPAVSFRLGDQEGRAPSPGCARTETCGHCQFSGPTGSCARPPHWRRPRSATPRIYRRFGQGGMRVSPIASRSA